MNKAHKSKTLSSLKFFSLSFIIMGLGIFYMPDANSSAISKKPSIPNYVEIKQFTDKSLTIKKNGYSIKKVSSVSSNTSVASVTSSKSGIKISGLAEGTTTIKTVIKATKNKKTKTFTIKTKVNVTKGDPFVVKTKDASHLVLCFSEPIKYLHSNQIWIRCTSDNANLFVAEDGLSTSDGGVTYTAKLKSPGLISRETYEITLVNTELKTTVVFKKKVPSLTFKYGKKKTIKDVKVKGGAKVGTFKLKNTYGMTPEYTLSGKDQEKFDISSSGVLTFKPDAKNKTKLKKYYVTVIATTPVTDEFELAETRIDLTIKLK